MQEGCIMLFMLFTYYSFSGRKEKRFIELCKRENNLFKACLQDEQYSVQLSKT